MFLQNVIASSALVALALTTSPALLFAQTPTDNVWGAEQKHIDNIFGILGHGHFCRLK